MNAPMTFPHPVPEAALDDRLGFVGIAGSGKTYGAGTAVERLLARKSRVIIVDPLGVWWGLRLDPVGTGRGFDVAIFGGAHGDLPLTEGAGAVIGETAAGMRESAIIDLSALGTKAAERRFMLAFLTALYRKAAGEPVHVVFDEADLWAPQRILDREADAAKLLGMMETLVRRGRIKGFVPWLITQRPAVISKDVLSQVDGLVAFKLTSSQDRKAIGEWIEGQADKEEGKAILAGLPAMDRGRAVVWVPGRSVLATAQFPPKTTFDSSRTPARGEAKHTADLKPLDLGALKERLASVEEETKANDPARLKKRIAELERELKVKAAAAAPTVDAAAVERARSEGYAEGERAGWNAGVEATRQAMIPRGRALSEALDALLTTEVPFKAAEPTPHTRVAPSPTMRPAPLRPASPAPSQPVGDLSTPQRKVIEALAFWRSLGFDSPTRVQVGAAAGYSPSSGGFNNLLGGLRTAGLIDYPQSGVVSLTEAGTAAAPEPSPVSARQRLDAVLSAPQAKIVDAIADGEEVSRDELGARTGYSPSSGGFNNLLGSLRSLGLITYPSRGVVAVEPWVFGDARP